MLDTGALVTIGLPFFNNEKTLKYTLRSIFNQTYTNWKLILINDGSTDHSYISISEEMLRDPRVQYIDDRTNRGLVSRLNQIAELCDTPYLARMDSDDLMMPERIEVQLSYLLANPKTDVLDSLMYSIDENNHVVGVRNLAPIADDPKAIVLATALNHATIMGKTEWFKNNKYDAAYLRAEDYELWCRTYAFSNFDRIPIPLYIVREGNVNINNYASTMKTCRKILNVYGKGILTSTELTVAIFKTQLKTALYRIYGAFKWQHFLTKRRNSQIEKKDEEKVKEVLAQIIY